MLQNLKMMLGIESADTTSDGVLNLIITNAKARLQNLLGGIEPPAALEYIILDVAAARFNRIGSEGMQSHSVEGESLSFAADDFAAFATDIQAFLDTQKESTRGRVRFI